eukprot:2661281-Amphidinium_carterae.1
MPTEEITVDDYKAANSFIQMRWVAQNMDDWEKILLPCTISGSSKTKARWCPRENQARKELRHTCRVAGLEWFDCTPVGV